MKRVVKGSKERDTYLTVEEIKDLYRSGELWYKNSIELFDNDSKRLVSFFKKQPGFRGRYNEAEQMWEFVSDMGIVEIYIDYMYIY